MKPNTQKRKTILLGKTILCLQLLDFLLPLLDICRLVCPTRQNRNRNSNRVAWKYQIPTTDVETRQVFYGILRIVDVFIYNKGRSSCFLRFPTIWLVPNTSIKRLHSNLTDVSIFAKYIIDFFVRNLVRKISTSSIEFSWSSLHIQNAVHFRR